MDNVLKFLMNHMSYLYNDFGFRIIDSMASRSFGDGYLTFEMDKLHVRLTSDRGQLLLTFRHTELDKKNSWHSWDVIAPLVTGEVYSSAIMTAHIASMLGEIMKRILELFSNDNALDTLEKIKHLKKERSKKIFPKKSK